MTRTLILMCAGLFACATQQGPAADDNYDPDSKADSGHSVASVRFYDPAAGKAQPVGGIAAKTFEVTADMKTKSIDVLDGDSSFGCTWAGAVEVAPADLAPILADEAKRKTFFNAVVYTSPTPAPDENSTVTLSRIARGKVFADVVGNESQEEWAADSQTRFKASLRILIKSMLQSYDARVWHVSISPDWTDDAWLSIDPKTGVIEFIVRGGDC
ncbi:MAG: hypothetical protein JWO36_2478 [Myxococcales bacterium]|nr:hypothetical protein [Myxococcales bacterium]